MYANRFIPITETRPSPRQLEGLAFQGRELLFGGAVGGGKSDFLLQAAAQYVNEPGYSALILRRTFRHLNQDGGLIPRSREWWADKAHWNQSEKRWTFPSGATITFGYLDHERDLDGYQGGAWQFVGIDEAGQIPDRWVRYFFSRLRRLKGSTVPIRLRLTANPGGIGHEFLKKRYIGSQSRKPQKQHCFLRSFLRDNPGLDADDYEQGLNELDPITRAQLLAGDWDAYEGGRFKGEWFREWAPGHDSEGRPVYLLEPANENAPIRQVLCQHCWIFISCDPAATAEDWRGSGEGDPDYTAIGVWAVTPDNDMLLLDVVRDRIPVNEIVPRLEGMCEQWHPLWVGIEYSSISVGIVDQARRSIGIPAVRPLYPKSQRKLVRATPAINKAYSGKIFLPDQADWLEDYLAEMVQFTGDDKLDAHDDQVDMTAYAVLAMAEQGLFEAVDVGETPCENEEWDYEADNDYGGMMGWRR